ncbi:MAG: hypothetical protein HC831_10270 [Chloroflexia bacterium]|nr:hypothetical protein [Chloroflexia bacterium]
MTMLSIYRPNRVPSISNRMWSNLLESFFDNDSRLDNSQYWVPRSNTLETEKEYTVELLIPGMKKEKYSFKP